MENFRKVLVTPRLAKEMLEKNSSNRNVSNASVEFYAKQMEEGSWKSNTFECIKVATDGTLLDGQHRLLAVIKSDTCQQLFIAYDLDKDLFDVLDTGKVRNGNDVFAISKIENPSIASAVIKGYFGLKKGSTEMKKDKKNMLLTNAMLLDEYNSRPDFWKETVSFSIRSRKKFENILQSPIIGMMYACFYDISPEDSRKFINELCTGNDISNESISILRRFLVKDKVSLYKLSSTEKVKCILRTWNAFRTKKEYKSVSFLTDASKSIKPI